MCLIFSNVMCTYKQGDSKSDVLLCFDIKFKSQVYNKLLKVISISKEYFICHNLETLVEWSKA